MTLRSTVEAMPGIAIGVSTKTISFHGRRAVHARGFEDVLRDLLEVGEEHPDDDRQVGEAEHDDQADMGVEQAGVQMKIR